MVVKAKVDQKLSLTSSSHFKSCPFAFYGRPSDLIPFFFSPSSFSHRVCEKVRERITSFLIQPFIYDRSLWWKGLLTIKTSLFLTPPGSNYKSKEGEEVIQFATSSWTESEISWILTNRKESFRWINMWWISSSFTPRKSNKLKENGHLFNVGLNWRHTHLMSDSKVVRNQFGSFSHLSFSSSVSLSFSPLEYLSSCLIACSWWWYSSSFTPLSTFITSSLPHSLWTFFLSLPECELRLIFLTSITPDSWETVSNLHCLNLLRWR